LTPEELEWRLEDRRFRPCGRAEPVSVGWFPPTGREDSPLTQVIGPFVLVCVQKEEKILPSSVVNETLAERAAEIEARDGRKVGKREKTELRDTIIHELLPRAFSHSRRTYAYVDRQGGWLVVDSASGKKTDELTSLLRTSVGELPIVFPATVEKPAVVMTRWLANDAAPSDIVIDHECELRAAEEDGGIVRCRRQDLTVPEVQNHLAVGKEASKLALSWADRLSFTLDDRLNVRRLRFLDIVQEKASDIGATDAMARFDADFSIMTLELAEFLPRLLELFGGERSPS
jgi:recombination associated protein RdgC